MDKALEMAAKVPGDGDARTIGADQLLPATPMLENMPVVACPGPELGATHFARKKRRRESMVWLRLAPEPLVQRVSPSESAC